MSLEFEIKSVSDPNLFDFVTLDPESGEIVLNTAWGMSGRSSITVSATDIDGLRTETTFFVDVNYENQPPWLTFTPSYEEDDTWIIGGYVTDDDDDVRGMIVVFTGVFEVRATVQDDGTFEFALVIDPSDWNEEWAYVLDPHGLSSAWVHRTISLT